MPFILIMVLGIVCLPLYATSSAYWPPNHVYKGG